MGSAMPSDARRACTTSGSKCVARAALELRDRRSARPRSPIQTVRRHRVEGIGDEDDPRAEWDLVAGDAVWITGPVPALVVMQNPVGDRLDAEALQHAVPDLGMPLYDEPLGARQRRRLLQDLLGDRKLAEVVQAPAEAGELDLVRWQAELLGDLRRQRSHACRVAARVRVA